MSPTPSAEASGASAPGTASPRRRRRPILGALAIGTALAVGGAGAIAATRDSRSAPAAARTASGLQPVAVEKKDLSTYTSYSGTLGFGDPVTISEGSVTATGAATSANGSGGTGTGGAGTGSAGALTADPGAASGADGASGSGRAGASRPATTTPAETPPTTAPRPAPVPTTVPTTVPSTTVPTTITTTTAPTVTTTVPTTQPAAIPEPSSTIPTTEPFGTVPFVVVGSVPSGSPLVLAQTTPTASASSGGASSGTVTALAAEGVTLTRGQVVYAVDDEPRVLFYGAVPAWRDLSTASTDGIDVYQLEQNLVALGYDPDHAVTLDRTFDDATRAAVVRWQAAAGATETGTVKLGVAVFLAGPARIGTHQVEVGGAARSGAAITEATIVGIAATTFNRDAGTVTFTQASGTVAKPGTVLFKLGEERPTVAFAGDAPLNRDLALGVTPGEDVRTLEENLVALGYDPGKAITVDNVFDEATVAAVELFNIEIGTAADGTVHAGTVAVVPDGLLVATVSAPVGTAVGAASPVLELAVSRRRVTLAVGVADRATLKVGDPVRITLPDGSLQAGSVAVIGSVAARTGNNANAAATVPVTVNLDGDRVDAGLVSAPVTVDVPKQTVKGVLAVPTSALVALREGGFALQVVEGTGTRLVGVKTGLYADNYVEVTGAGINAATKVMVPS